MLGNCLLTLESGSVANENMGANMSFEVLEQLEARVQSAVDSISLLKMELDELKGQNHHLQNENQHLQNENQQLRNDHHAWQERLRNLLGKMDHMDESV